MSNDNTEPLQPPQTAEKERQKVQEGIEFFRRAARQKEKRKKSAIIHFRGIPLVSEDRRSEPGWFVVQPKSRAYLLGPGFAEPTLLGPGKYPLERLAASVAQKVKFHSGEKVSRRVTDRLCVACTVSDMPIACDVSIPDDAQAEEAVTWEKVLGSFSLRTRDNILGGAELQMSMVCEAPVKLLKAFGSDQIEQIREGTVWQTDYNVAKEAARRSGLISQVGDGVFKRMATYLFGQEEEEDVEFALSPKPFTVDHLYEQISLELATSVRASVRKFSAQELYDEIEPRTAVERDIQRDMGVTLANYGMRLDRVTAFQFISPEYDKLLRNRAGIELQKQSLQDRRADADVKDRQREIEREQYEKETTDEAQRERYRLEEQAKTKEVTEEQATEEQKRQLERDAAHKAHDRDQRAEDERLRMDLMFEKASRALELQNQMASAQWERQRQMLEFYKDVPADRLLQLAMIQNPQLASTFAAAQQAQEIEKRAALQQKFQEELVRVYGQNRDQTQQLLLEAAKQIGRVVTAKVSGKDPEQITKSEIVVHERLPAPEADRADS